MVFGRPAAEEYSAAPCMPLTFGGDVGDALEAPILLRVDAGQARRPVGRGPAPLPHPLLPLPEMVRLAVPQFDLAYADPLAGLESASPLEALQRDPALRHGLPAGAISLDRSGPFSQRLDPVYPFVLYLALTLGTYLIGLTGLWRYTLLWTVLIALGVFFTLVDAPGDRLEMSSASLGWGVSFGLVFSLPLLILVRTGLSDMVGVLFAGFDVGVLFQSAVLISPVGESLFFRGAFQERRGLLASILGAGLGGLALYWPATAGQPVFLLAVAIFTTVLATIYSFVRTRYGLAAAFICQMTVNLMLLFIPGVLG